jgi:endoglucanase
MHRVRAVWKNIDWLLHTAYKYNVSMLWDTNASFVVNGPTQHGDQNALNITLFAAKGTSNALPDTTIDHQTITQFTPSCSFQRRRQTPKTSGLPFIWNDHKLLSNKQSL